LEEAATSPKQKQDHQPKKQKWGPELLMERPRRNVGDNRTMLQKAADLKSYKNMEVPVKGAGNSFAILEPQYLAQIASNVGVSLGSNGCMKNDENTKSNLFKDQFLESCYQVIWKWMPL
jgi:hypothetical protein